jgi:Fe2+ transport system protein FeoA
MNAMIFKSTRQRHRHRRHGCDCGRLNLRGCRAGETVVIEQIEPDVSCAPRLRELGLIEGSVVLVLRCTDPLLLLSQDSRIAIDLATAEQIQVSPAGS